MNLPRDLTIGGHAKIPGDHDTEKSRWRSRCACGWVGNWQTCESKGDRSWVDHMLAVLPTRGAA